jgi:ATP-binding cassette subfamily F protein uup
MASKPTRQKTDRPRSAAPARRVGFKEKRELQDLPLVIERLETEKHALFAAMAAPGFYATPAEEIARSKDRLAAIDGEIHEAYERWSELEARVAGDGQD